MNTFMVISLADLNPMNYLQNLNPANWEVVKEIGKALKSVAEVCDYILHPTKIFIAFWNFTWEISYILCLCTALVALILYILGYKKYAKVVPCSMIVLIVIKAVGKIV